MLKLIFILMIPAASLGVVVRHDIAIDAYRGLAASEPFAGVAAVKVGAGFGGRTGSGVVLADRWLLTAAHVVWGVQASSVRVEIGGRQIQAAEIRYPTAWANSPQTSLSQGSDLALIRLAENSGVASTDVFSGTASGQVAFLGGFGRTGNGILGAAGSSELLVAMNVIDRQIATANGGGFLVTDFDDGTIARNSLDAAIARRTYYDAGFSAPLLTSTVLDAGPSLSQATFLGLPTAADFFPGLAAEFLEGTSASGDSGGPLFLFDAATGQWTVAGITSWGVNPLLPAGFARTDSRYGDLAFFTDLTANSDWIFANIPEPSVAWMIVISLTLIVSKRVRG